MSQPPDDPKLGVVTRAPRRSEVGRRVLVLYNCDFDVPGPHDTEAQRLDGTTVAKAAHQVRDAVAEYGYPAEILGVAGSDIARCLDALREAEPDLIFNLTESLNQDSRNEIVSPGVFDMLGYRYPGWGALAMGLALHKPKAKDIRRSRGVPPPASCTIERVKDAAGVALPYPLFVKLAREDASVGIRHDNVVQTKRALVRRVLELLV